MSVVDGDDAPLIMRELFKKDGEPVEVRSLEIGLPLPMWDELEAYVENGRAATVSDALTMLLVTGLVVAAKLRDEDAEDGEFDPDYEPPVNRQQRRAETRKVKRRLR